jgi:tetratricopeptide (TPR) repeat protein
MRQPSDLLCKAKVISPEESPTPSVRRLTGLRQRANFLILSTAALLYALLAGLRTVSDYDLFWQMATGRWVALHHTVFSTDVFSFTAQGQPWIYPVGSGLLFYLVFLMGGYGLISWLGAITCVGTVTLLLRGGSAATAALAIIAVPAIAARTSPRADMFTIVMSAAFLSILWEQHENGTGKLWLLPLLMVLWANLHLGFIAGLALTCTYTASEAIRMLAGPKKRGARQRMSVALLCLLAMLVATLVNPWGWSIYRALLRQEAAMSVHSERITEWIGISLTSATLKQAFSVHDPASSGEWLLLSAAIAIVIALLRKQWFAAMLLAGALWIAVRHVRFLVLLACVVVVVGGAIFTSLLEAARSRIPDRRLYKIVVGGVVAGLVLLAGLRSVDLVSNRYYVSGNEINSFGTGLSWWFPERAMDFIERENLPPQVFNGYEQGGFLVWRLGPRYHDYIDGRAIPFGPDALSHLQQLLQSQPDSPVWQHEIDAYDIKTVVFSLARYNGLKYAGSVLPGYCNSEQWKPVYLDEVSVVLVRRMPETQALIERFPVDCSTAPLPIAAHSRSRSAEFNRWANSAALLLALHRNQEAAAASAQALSIFGDSAALWYIRGKALLLTGNPREAERDLLQSASLETSVATWSELADLYRSQRRFPAAIDALERLSAISPNPPAILIALGYTYLESGRARDALHAFDRAEKGLSPGTSNPALADADNGRALAWSMLGDLGKATFFQEKAASLAPETSSYWNQLAHFYDLQGRATDAQKASERAASLRNARQP